MLKQAMIPLGSLLLVMLLCWLLRKKLPRLSAVFFWPAFALLYVLCLPFTTQQLAQQLETQPSLASSSWPSLSQQAEAIVVLGGGRQFADSAWGSDQPSLLTQQRLRYAARIAKASSLPILVSGGNNQRQPPSEAQLMAEALSQDFAVDARWREDFSRNTWENARFSADILHAEDIRRIVLVTDAWHMPRARWSFEQHGFEVISAAQGFWSNSGEVQVSALFPSTQALWHNSLLLHEWLGMQHYRKNMRPVSFSID